MSAIDDLHELEAIQEAAWEALKASAPAEHAAHCEAVGSRADTPTILAARDAFYRSGSPEAIAYSDAVHAVIAAQQALTDEEFDSMAPRCERCDDNGVITVVVAGPDYFGNYDTDEIECPDCGDES